MHYARICIYVHTIADISADSFAILTSKLESG